MVDMNKVEEYRANLGIPKSVIAKKCEVTVQTYDNWVERPMTVSARASKSLADALGIVDTDLLMAIFFAPNVQESLNS